MCDCRYKCLVLAPKYKQYVVNIHKKREYVDVILISIYFSNKKSFLNHVNFYSMIKAFSGIKTRLFLNYQFQRTLLLQFFQELIHSDLIYSQTTESLGL